MLNFLKVIHNTVLLSPWNPIHICYFCLCLCQHGAYGHIHHGSTVRVRSNHRNLSYILHEYFRLLHENVCYSPSADRLEKVNLKCNSGRAKVLGTLVCLCGAAILTLYKGVPLFDHSKSTSTQITMMDHGIKLSSTRNKERWTIGSIALVAGTLLWSSWFLVQSNIGKLYPCQYSSTTIMNFFGAIQSGILGLCTSKNLSVWVLRGKAQVLTVMFAVSILFLLSRLATMTIQF